MLEGIRRSFGGELTVLSRLPKGRCRWVTSGCSYLFPLPVNDITAARYAKAIKTCVIFDMLEQCFLIGKGNLVRISVLNDFASCLYITMYLDIKVHFRSSLIFLYFHPSFTTTLSIRIFFHDPLSLSLMSSTFPTVCYSQYQ
jgi:hypothetical protein